MRPSHSRQPYALALVALWIAIAILPACAPLGAPAPALTPIRVQLRWTHQAQFAGYYAADQYGYYAVEGLAVTFIEGGSNVDLVTPVVDGRAHFSVIGADTVLLARAQQHPIRAIAVLYQRSPVVFVTLADSGITRPEEFVGKTIRATPDTAPTLHAMMARLNVPPDQYTVITLPNDAARFASGDPPIWVMFITGFGVTLQRSGNRLNLIYPDDYGVHNYADSLVVSDELIARDPELVERFLRASLKGWTQVVEQPDKAGALVQRVAPGADPALETAKMVASVPLIHTGENPIGSMRAERWEDMARLLREQGILTGTLDVQQAYTLQFLETVGSRQ